MPFFSWLLYGYINGYVAQGDGRICGVPSAGRVGGHEGVASGDNLLSIVPDVLCSDMEY